MKISEAVPQSSYDELGEFHDLFMTEAWDGLQPLVAATFGDLRADQVVVEVGAGSGLGTQVLARASRAQIVSLEPNLLMRSMLTARVAADPDLSRRVTVMAGSAPTGLKLLPRRVDGVVCAHVLGHLDPLELRSLFAWVADSLTPHGSCLVTTQEFPESSGAPSADSVQSRTLGWLEYRLRYREAPDSNTFVSRYEVWDGRSMLRAVEVQGPWRTVGTAELEASVAGTALSVVPLRPGAALLKPA